MAFHSMFFCGNRKDKKKEQRIWRTYSLKELQAATNYFNKDNTLAEGEFSSVYWGQLWNGSQVAVRRLKANTMEKEYVLEIEILARMQHKNLLSFRGYCAEDQERMIVSDYMPNSNLFSHLHGQYSGEGLLNWNYRMKIAVGMAEGIAYLHHYATPRIIHRDIKPSNVLLGKDFEAQISGFNHAKLIPDGATEVTTRVKGSLGYLAPEYAMFGKASLKCDVYSFGILLLELATGKKPINKLSNTKKYIITDWAESLASEGKYDELADPNLNGQYTKEELKRVIFVALTCANPRPEKRPTMLEVVVLLKGESREN